MKKITLLVLIFVTSMSIAQEKEKEYPQDINKKHELKLNAFNLIVLSSLDVSYERLLNKDSSFGVGVFYNFNNINNDLYYPKKFSLTPYYRWFFTETRFARGFFVEGFGMLNTYEEENYGYYDNTGNYISSSNDIMKDTSFALGISVGGKFIIKSGFTAEVYLGVGRNLFDNNKDNYYFDNEIITRGGISLGYRF